MEVSHVQCLMPVSLCPCFFGDSPEGCVPNQTMMISGQGMTLSPRAWYASASLFSESMLVLTEFFNVLE